MRQRCPGRQEVHQGALPAAKRESQTGLFRRQTLSFLCRPAAYACFRAMTPRLPCNDAPGEASFCFLLLRLLTLLLGGILHRYPDEITPFRPGTVIVTDRGVSKQMGQHKPGVRAALADAAIGDHVLIRRKPLF